MLIEFDKYNELKSLEQRYNLESALIQIWESRFFPYSEEIEETMLERGEDIGSQPFLDFDGLRYRPRNFIGFIYTDGNLIEINPKVFKNSSETDKVLILRHIFYWMKYCRRLYFPFKDAPLENMSIDRFPELIIHLFAKSCYEIIYSQPFSRFEEVSESLLNPKGRLDFALYVKKNMTKGDYHLLNCIYEPFVYDNKLNRAIKYVCRLLINYSKVQENQQLLQDIVYVLDEVEDIPCRASELEQLKLNSLFADYKLIIDWCIRFLEQQLYSPLSYESFQWTLLLPMEYIYEDFIAGFLMNNFWSRFKIYPQKSDLNLSTEPEAFRMKHDILLVNKENGEEIIIDTKYKPRWNINSDDKKEGVSQADMYQMVSYAYRRGCRKVILLYPNAYEDLKEDKRFFIKSGFNGNELVEVYVSEVPFWSLKDFNNLEIKLKDSFNKILLNNL